MTGDGNRAALRSIHALFDGGTVGGLDDMQLLDRFATLDREAAGLAFGALVERHGPMVFRVCRGVLRDEHDAEDAFQATFLILARKARSIRSRASLASWLHGVARNVAATARSDAARRLRHETRAGESRPRSADGSAGDDLVPTVHEEIARLPERYRSAVVLCCLDGLTQHEAARRLGWPLGTLQSRLARGRERLRDRLTRRGLAPSVAIPPATFAGEAMPAAVPAWLVSKAVRASTKGTASVAVGILARRGLRTMLLEKWKAAGAAIALASGIVATGVAVRAAHQDSRPAPPPGPIPPAVESPGDGQLTVAGRVLMPDGSPAAGAVVETAGNGDERPTTARTDEAGRFVLRGVFGNGCQLRASSADGKLQARLWVPEVAARSALASPLRLPLSPATEHEITVLAGGRPVEGAHVAALGAGFRTRGVTDRDGRVDLRYPAGEKPQRLVAWHPELGCDGREDFEKGIPGEPARLALLPAGPLRIRVVDTDGRPVAGLGLGVNFRPKRSGWIVSEEIAPALVRTDTDGSATVPWAPLEALEFVEVNPIDPGWKFDETDSKRLAERLVTVHARPEKAVEGRLVMPEGADPEGILVSGFGFGPANNGDIPHARARRDGRFTLRVPSEHAYVLGVSDLKWAADPWSGVILGRDGGAAEIVMNVYPATPVTARVTRGPGREPVANAWVELSSRGKVAWIDAKGEKQSGNAGVSGWLKTDAEGMARAGVGRGEHRWRLSSGFWDEERTIRVDSPKPVEIEFHRPWLGDRKVSGRLMSGKDRHEPSAEVVARAWEPQPQTLPHQFPVEVHPDGTFEVAYDAESLSLYLFDRAKQRGGFARLGWRETAVDVVLEATASYSGILRGEDDRPLPDRPLQLFVKGSRYQAVESCRTDREGRFRFPIVPAKVPMELSLGEEGQEPGHFIADRDRLFEPSEARNEYRLTALRDGSPPVPPPPVPLAENIEGRCRDAHATGLRVLIILQGDASQGVLNTVARLLDDGRARTVLGYLPLPVEAGRLDAEAATLADRGWPRPAPGEVVLIALDGDRKTIGVKKLATPDVAAATVVGDDFLKRQGPPTRDAPASLARAREEARASGRRVLVVHSGPRCGPCFRMARWIEEHRATLEKDYAIVEMMEGVDDHVAEAVARLPEKDGDGIPWYAITEPDGTVLATSVGPSGNIGFPASVEGVRHLRRMIERTARTLTPDERDDLVRSLSPDR